MSVLVILLIAAVVLAACEDVGRRIHRAEAKHQRTQAERWKTVAARETAASIAAEKRIRDLKREAGP